MPKYIKCYYANSHFHSHFLIQCKQHTHLLGKFNLPSLSESKKNVEQCNNNTNGGWVAGWRPPCLIVWILWQKLINGYNIKGLAWRQFIHTIVNFVHLMLVPDITTISLDTPSLFVDSKCMYSYIMTSTLKIVTITVVYKPILTFYTWPKNISKWINAVYLLKFSINNTILS